MATSIPTTGIIRTRSFIQPKDISLAVGVIIIVGLMILPIPAGALDLLIALNLALSIGIMLLTMYIEKPVDFSVFPTVLLLVTLFRLGINIAASRSILINADAGKVVDAFGGILVGGNYVVGVVLFLMLMIIQFTVINSGAARVAEVTARFTLDAMPGKQMAIDADLNAGMIDESQAQARRLQIGAEADFYGALDGATKFVKGDSTAAIIIMIVNIIGGIVIGVVQHNMDIIQALQRYTLLTVGSGLVIQIPAILVASASGLIVTRSRSNSSLGADLGKQLSNFTSLIIGAAIIGAIGLVPGLPSTPFLLVSAILAAAAFLVQRTKKQEKDAEIVAKAIPAATEPESPADMLSMVVIDPIELEIGYGLISLIDENDPDNLLKRVTAIRRQIMAELGLVLPIVRIRDNLRLQPQAYKIKIRGQDMAEGTLMIDHKLAIPGSDSDENFPGIKTSEPAFGLPALWINDSESGRAELMGYTVVAPLSVLSTHLTEVVRNHAPELLSRQMVKEMLDQLRSKSPATIEGVVPEMVSLGDVQAVMRNLLRERVPIRDLAGIIEVLANNAGFTRDANVLAEAVRQTMASTLSTQFRDDNNTLHVFTLSPQIESMLKAALGSAENGISFNIDASFAQALLTQTGAQMERLAQAGFFPILLCPRELRLAYRRLVEQSLPNLVVLAFSEVSQGTKVRAHGMVEIPLGN
ncbi:MAG TPA: flagellar biosynthesis protein FlhA [Anaerolineaceae bacterium]|nr:flagellar biosynthesis protein FlhA [Anaerolineaceae bacterium]